MDEFLKMDVFFLVTTVAVVVIGVLVGYGLWRFNRILKNIEHITEQVAMESDIIRQDIGEMRSEIRSGKSRIMSLFGLLGKFRRRKSKKKS